MCERRTKFLLQFPLPLYLRYIKPVAGSLFFIFLVNGPDVHIHRPAYLHTYCYIVRCTWMVSVYVCTTRMKDTADGRRKTIVGTWRVDNIDGKRKKKKVYRHQAKEIVCRVCHASRTDFSVISLRQRRPLNDTTHQRRHHRTTERYIIHNTIVGI